MRRRSLRATVGGLTWVLLAFAAACVETVPARRIPETFGARSITKAPIHVAGETGFIGLRVEDNQSSSLDDLEFFPGVRVVDVIENSPAARSGLRLQDVILSIDTTPINDREAFEALVKVLEPGSDIVLEVQRGTELFTQRLHVTGRLVAGPPPERPRHVERIKARLEAATRVIEVNGARRGAAEIIALFDESPLRARGLGPGDLILAVDDQPIESAADLVAAIHERRAGERIRLTSWHAGVTETGPIDLWSPPRKLRRLHIPLVFTYEADPDPDSDALRIELLDLYLFSLFRYQRDGLESSYTLLSLFSLSFGAGDLVELHSPDGDAR